MVHASRNERRNTLSFFKCSRKSPFASNKSSSKLWRERGVSEKRWLCTRVCIILYPSCINTLLLLSQQKKLHCLIQRVVEGLLAKQTEILKKWLWFSEISGSRGGEYETFWDNDPCSLVNRQMSQTRLLPPSSGRLHGIILKKAVCRLRSRFK
jgi:hypothetical protein